MHSKWVFTVVEWRLHCTAGLHNISAVQLALRATLIRHSLALCLAASGLCYTQHPAIDALAQGYNTACAEQTSAPVQWLRVLMLGKQRGSAVSLALCLWHGRCRSGVKRATERVTMHSRLLVDWAYPQHVDLV